VQAVRRRLKDGGGGSVSASVLLPEDWGARVAGAGQRTVIVLGHGAGAGMDHSFMTAMQSRLAARGNAVVLFNFPYKERGGRAPDRAGVLETCYRAVVGQLRADPQLRPQRLLIGGKSMGGRIATQIAAAGCEVDGIILLGYPLHPPGKPERLRRAHLPEIAAPMLFLQGTRDPLCNLEDLRQVLGDVRAPVEVHVVEGGDHSFKVPKRSGRTHDDVLDELADRCDAWLGRLKPQK
jgi:uncharacterized protein